MPKEAIRLKLLQVLKILPEVVVRHYLESKVKGRKDRVEASSANRSLAINCLKTRAHGRL